MLHEIITTEKVPFTFRVAGIGSRFLAWWCDALVVVGLELAGALFISPLEEAREGLGVALMLLWQFVLLWGYFVFFEWLWRGQTPGKRLVGIRVIDVQGTNISFFQSAVRNVLRVADGLPVPFVLYGLGFAVAACNREQRRLGDLAAGTLVVHVERRASPIQALTAGRVEFDRSRQALLRQRLAQLDHPQKQTLLDLCLRRDQLRIADRARLFHTAAEFCRARLDLAPEEYQSEEKFILELSAALTDQGAKLTMPSGGPVRFSGAGMPG